MTLADIQARAEAWRAHRTELYHGDFLLTWDHSDAEIRSVIELAEILKRWHEDGRSCRVFESGLAISVFRDKSTRTRFSFASAADLLGLGLSELDEEKSQVSHGETLRETAAMISFLTEVIGIRDDMYLGRGHSYMRDFGAALSQATQEGVLPRRPSVINLQCDVDHPTQSLADLAWLSRHLDGVEQLRGRTLTMSWAYSPSYGKPLSVPQGVIGLLTRFGVNVRLAHPPGYDLLPEVVERARTQALASGGSFEQTDDMDAAFEGADLVYPKSWAPHHVMQRRTDLLEAGDRAGLVALEQECLAANAEHSSWECDRARMDLTAGGKALYLHCLPADISGVSCERGEVSAEVFEQYRLATYHEASYKPFVIAALIFLTRLPDPAAVLDRILARDDRLSL